MDLVIIYGILINTITFLMFGVDKWKARKGKRRIPERALLLSSIIGGTIGAYVAMWFFRHKTKKVKFYLGIPLIFLLQAGGFLWILSYL